MRYQNAQLVHSPEAEKEDEAKSEERVTMELLASIASSIHSFLDFTHQVAENDSKLPVLDMQISLQKHQASGPWFQIKEGKAELLKAPEKESQPGDEMQYLAYEFFAKQMANPMVILRRSGISESTKVATMTSEMRHRWKNTLEGASTPTLEEITVKFVDNLIG